MSGWARHFSMPMAGGNVAVLDTIAAAYGGSVVSSLLERHGDEIDESSQGLTVALDDWTKTKPDFATVWDISFGRAHLALKEHRLDLADVAARLALRMADSGLECSWSARVPSTSVTIGRAFLADVSEISASIDGSGGGLVTLGRVDGTVVELRRRAGEQWTGPGAVPISAFGIEAPIQLLSRDMLPADAGSREVFGECLPVTSVDESMRATFQAGIDVLSHLTPQYIPWIEQVLHGVVVCSTQEPFHLVSGSWEDVPGRRIGRHPPLLAGHPYRTAAVQPRGQPTIRARRDRSPTTWPCVEGVQPSGQPPDIVARCTRLIAVGNI